MPESSQYFIPSASSGHHLDCHLLRHLESVGAEQQKYPGSEPEVAAVLLAELKYFELRLPGRPNLAELPDVVSSLRAAGWERQVDTLLAPCADCPSSDRCSVAKSLGLGAHDKRAS